MAELQRAAYRSGQHRRTVTNIASLALGINYFLAFAQDIGALSPDACAQYWERCWRALLSAANQQGQHQDAHEPTRQFLSLLSAALASGRAHVAAPDGLAPQSPGAWGWRERVLGTGDFTREEWQPQGKRVGWLEEDHLYLEPHASYAEAQELARQQGESLGVSAQTLRKRLHEKRLLVSTGKVEGRETLLVRKTLEGRRRHILHLSHESLGLSTHFEPDQPDQAEDVEESGQVLWAGFWGVVKEPDHGSECKNDGSDTNGQVGQVFTSNNGAYSQKDQSSPESWSAKPDQDLTTGEKNPTTEKRREPWTFPRRSD
jgi:hypothetical protein